MQKFDIIVRQGSHLVQVRSNIGVFLGLVLPICATLSSLASCFAFCDSSPFLPILEKSSNTRSICSEEGPANRISGTNPLALDPRDTVCDEVSARRLRFPTKLHKFSVDCQYRHLKKQ